MTLTPYLISGIVYSGSYEGETTTEGSISVPGSGNTVNFMIGDGTITKSGITVVITVNGEELSTTTNDSGQYIIDLANLPSGYSDGDTFSITVTDIKTDINFDKAYDNPEARKRVFADKEGRRHSDTYPIPVANIVQLNSDNSNGGNFKTTWSITRGDKQPDTETRTYNNGDSYTRSFSYTNNVMTERGWWIKNE